MRDSLLLLHVGKFYPPHMGGIETHLRDLVSQQSASMAVEVLVANETARMQSEYLDGAKIVRLPTVARLASMPICPSLPFFLSRRPDSLLHIHLPNPWAALSLMASTHRGPVILTHHSDTLGRRRLRRLSDPLVCRAMDRASAIIVTSRRYLETSEELVAYREKCHVIPLGIDPSVFARVEPAGVESIRQQYGSNLILAIGRLVGYKGFEYLVDAMREVDATLLLIGTGPLRDRLKNRIAILGLQKKVRMLGYIDNVAPYFKAAQMLVLPSISRAESFGMVQLEAMAAGLPVVNTEIDSGVPEVSPHGITGLTVAPRDSSALSHAINSLLRSPEMRQQYGQNGLQRVRQHYSVRHMVERTLRIYESAMVDPRDHLASGATADRY